MPISVWVKKLEQEAEQRALVVMEPVERTVAMVTFNAEVYFNISNSIFYNTTVLEIKKIRKINVIMQAFEF